MTRVLIAVDDSDSSVAAARTAHRLFGDDAEYIVVNVSDSNPLKWGDDTLMYGTVCSLVRDELIREAEIPVLVAR